MIEILLVTTEQSPLVERIQTELDKCVSDFQLSQVTPEEFPTRVTPLLVIKRDGIERSRLSGFVQAGRIDRYITAVLKAPSELT